MKKQYITPVLEIETVKMMKNLMLSVSVGEAFKKGESATAESKQFSDEYSLGDKYIWE